MCVLRCFSLVSKVGKTSCVFTHHYAPSNFSVKNSFPCVLRNPGVKNYLCAIKEEQRKGDTTAAGRCKKTMLGVRTDVRVR